MLRFGEEPIPLEKRLQSLLELAFEQIRQLLEQRFIVLDCLLKIRNALFQGADHRIFGVGGIWTHDRTISSGHHINNP